MNFIGVDLHKKSITVCVMDEKRKVLARKTLACTQTGENQPSVVMRSAKRWKTRDRTASQKAHQTGMGRRSIASQKPLKVLPGRCRLGA